MHITNGYLVSRIKSLCDYEIDLGPPGMPMKCAQCIVCAAEGMEGLCSFKSPLLICCLQNPDSWRYSREPDATDRLRKGGHKAPAREGDQFLFHTLVMTLTTFSQFKTQYRFSEAYHMAQMRDLPPIAGAIIWARQIERQLQYMKRVEDVHGRGWEHYAEGQKFQSESVAFRKKFDTRPCLRGLAAGHQPAQHGC
jgi:hypothetical protein